MVTGLRLNGNVLVFARAGNDHCAHNKRLIVVIVGVFHSSVYADNILSHKERIDVQH